MGQQIGGGKDSGRHCQDRAAHQAGGLDISRGIAHEARPGAAAQPPPDLFQAVSKNVAPQLPPAAERTEGEEFLHSGGLQLQPADGLQVAGNYPQQFAGAVKPGKKSWAVVVSWRRIPRREAAWRYCCSSEMVPDETPGDV